MNKCSILATVLLCAVPFLSSGCVSNLGGDDYSRGEARRTMHVRFATVESVRSVSLEGTKSLVGMTAGAVAGGAIGRSIAGRGSTAGIVGTVAGAVAGSVGGAALEEAATRKRGVEITIQLDSGGYLAVVQADGGEDFQPGEWVRLVGSGESARVTR
jgi:outer membrane lipoprotein SlyB